MKKLLLVLALITFGLTCKAQSNLDSTSIQTYRIDTVGYSNGLVIPSPFYVFVTKIKPIIKGSKVVFIATIKTRIDTISLVNLPNDNIPNRKKYKITESKFKNNPFPEIFTKDIKQYLKSIYGANNIVKIN